MTSKLSVSISRFVSMASFFLALCFVPNVALSQDRPYPDPELVQKIDSFFEDSRFQNAYWGVVVESLETGEVWYERNAGKLFMPASNEKIPTSAAALTVLGPDWKFTTDFRTNGEITDDGVLEGDLIVFGNGDPTLYERVFDDSRDVFREVAKALHDKGISRIAGKIVGDDNAFDDQHLGYGWPFDGLPIWYSAEFGPLQINENYVDLRIVPPDSADGEVRVEPNLPSSYFKIVNKLEVRESGWNRVSIDRAVGSNEIVLTGRVRAGSDPFERSPTITNPTLFYVTVLKEVLQEQWIEVDGEAIDCDDIEGWDVEREGLELLHQHKSPPLSEVLKLLMKRSQNMYAETMVRVLGWHDTGTGSWRAGSEVVEEQLEQFGIEEGTYRFMDGSGLSRYNYTSPRILTEILKGMRKHEYWPVWRDIQPVAGVDGTLRSRMKGTAAEGNVRAKTGTISNVRALSGYVTTAAGEELVFSFIVNAHTASNSATEEVTDGALAFLAAYDVPPPGREEKSAAARTAPVREVKP